jgi:hypothetical protein
VCESLPQKKHLIAPPPAIASCCVYLIVLSLLPTPPHPLPHLTRHGLRPLQWRTVYCTQHHPKPETRSGPSVKTSPVPADSALNDMTAAPRFIGL